MDNPIAVTAVFTAVLAVMQIFLAVYVGIFRTKTDILFLDGGNEELLRRIRAHGNFTENVPMALLVMAGAEMSGVSTMIITAVGCVLILARVIHFAAITKTGPEIGRAIGAGGTSLAIILMAILIMSKSIGSG